MRSWMKFPNPVNEVAARLVAAGVVAMTLLVLAGAHWVLVPLAYGFVARVLAGPAISPLGRIATQLVVPRLRVAPRFVAGPPKRFAQGIGALLSVSALFTWLAGATPAALVLVALIAVAASLEAAVGFCLGCKIFAGLMRVGLIPESACAACADITSHVAARASAAA